MALILHVTEALGAGVAHSISQLAKTQVKLNEVMVIYSRRPDTPSETQLDILLPFPIKRKQIYMVTKISPIKDCLSLFLLIRLFNQIQPKIIHLHSSKAGALGRIASIFFKGEVKVFYSPRGFAFLRQDVSLFKRWIYLLFERVSTILPGILVACSKSEMDLAINSVYHNKVVLVENSVDLKFIQAAKRTKGSRLRVVTSGRLCFQKAPWKFGKLADTLSYYPVDFLWIGGGEGDLLRTEKISLRNLKVTGWRDRKGVLKELSRADVFIMTSLWEGMPLSLIEAQMAGLPAVVPDVIGCRDIVHHGYTGYICQSDDELIEYVRKLILDSRLRHQMSINAHKMAKERFNVERMNLEMMKIYDI